MPLPRTAPIGDVPHDVVCRLDPAIPEVVCDFDAVLLAADVGPEPPYHAISQSDRENSATYLGALSAWEKVKAEAITQAFLATEDALTLGTKARDFAQIQTETSARAMVLALMEAARWERYCVSGDIAELGPWVDGEEPTRFTVTQVTEQDKVHIVGALNAGATQGRTDYEHIYSLNLWLLGRTLRAVTPWPEGWPALVRVGVCVAPESLALLPHAWVTDLGTYLIGMAQLRKAEKKV